MTKACHTLVPQLTKMTTYVMFLPGGQADIHLRVYYFTLFSHILPSQNTLKTRRNIKYLLYQQHVLAIIVEERECCCFRCYEWSTMLLLIVSPLKKVIKTRTTMDTEIGVFSGRI